MAFPNMPNACHCGSRFFARVTPHNVTRLAPLGPGGVLENVRFINAETAVTMTDAVVYARNVTFENVRTGFEMHGQSGGVFDNIEHTFTPSAEPPRKERRGKGRRAK